MFRERHHLIKANCHLNSLAYISFDPPGVCNMGTQMEFADDHEVHTQFSDIGEVVNLHYSFPK